LTLRVTLDDEGIRPVSKTYRAEESFEVAVSNEGSPKHVNLSVTGEAQPYVSVQVNNVYVAEGDEETVEVVVGPTPGEVEGNLEVSSDYGSDSAEVELVLGDEGTDMSVSTEEDGVEVDESLSQPINPEAEAEAEEIPRVDIAVGVVLGLAVFLSLLFGILFGQMGIALVVISIAILGGAMVWTIKRTAEGPRPKD
jgi:hypothetical protein